MSAAAVRVAMAERTRPPVQPGMLGQPTAPRGTQLPTGEAALEEPTGGAGPGQQPKPPVPQGPRPEQVHLSVQLWWASIVLGLAEVIGSVAYLVSVRMRATREIVDQLREADSTLEVSDAQADAVFWAAVGVSGALGLVFAGVVWLLANRMGKGRNWARMALLFVAAMSVTTAFPVLVGSGSQPLAFGVDGTGALFSILGGLQILTAVAALGAGALMFWGKDVNTWFIPPRPRP